MKHALSLFIRSEKGSILTFWAFALVIFMGLLAMTFDLSRMAATQTELQSYADNVALAAAGELDGRSDAIVRATGAASALIADSQTYAAGAQALSAADYSITFLSGLPASDATTTAAYVTTNAHLARYARVAVANRRIDLGFGAAFAALSGRDAISGDVGAEAVAGFEQQACDVTPLTFCLPTVDFSAAANIGKTLKLNANAGVGLMGLGSFATLATDLLPFDELGVCAGLLGDTLQACLLAAKGPKGTCTPGGGLEISADLSVAEIDAALNVRFGSYTSIAAGLAANPNFAAAPNVLAGALSAAGVCLPVALPLTTNAQGLPADDCVRSGMCGVLGNGTWTQGRTAYVNAHYKGVDPFPGARTRYAYYKAEVAAQAAAGPRGGIVGSTVGGLLNGGVVGGLVGGLLGAPKPLLCSPAPALLPERRLLVAAGIDCSLGVSASVTTPPVKEFFEVFMLGPAENGILNVEIVACLGGRCGKGNTDTMVRDVVRLHR